MDIKNKTIFDFCKDQEIIKNVLGGDYSEFYHRSLPKTIIYNALADYACLIGNQDLWEAATREYKEAEKDFERMAAEAAKNGLLID